MSDSDSDSSSGDFGCAPVDLDELEDLKPNSFQTEDKPKSDTDLENSNGAEEVQTSEYFDFTRIISAQETLESLKKKALVQADKSESDVSPVKLVSPVKRGKTRAAIKKQKNVIKQDLDSELVDVKALLELGEQIKEDEEESDSSGEEQNKFATPDAPQEGVEVTIELPNAREKKEKKAFDVQAAIKRRLNNVKKQQQVFVHKVHVLCLIAHGNFLNKLINDEHLMATALSIIPSNKYYPPKMADIDYLEKLVGWFSKKVKVMNTEPPAGLSWTERLEKQFDLKEAYTSKDLTLMFVCTARVLGLSCRLMISLQPEPLRPRPEQLHSFKKDSSTPLEKSTSPVPKKKSSPKVQAPSGDKARGRKEKSVKTKPQVKESDSNPGPSNSRAKRRSNRTKTPIKNFKPTSSEERDLEDSDFELPKKKVRKSNGQKKPNEPCTSRNRSCSKSKGKDSSIDRRVFSSDSEGDVFIEEKKKKKSGSDYWAEIFVEAEEKWISLDIIRGKIHCVDQIYSRATHPVNYVLGWNTDCTIKDLTQRYAPQYATVTRKLRVEDEWFRAAIKSWRPKRTAREKLEDEELKRVVETKPLPATIGEYKNHPLYVLKRHLLKYQALYPPDAPPLGFVRKEPVYSRLCVFTLHTRETWVRKAKQVKLGEEPYKIVKARPKWDRLTKTIVSDLPSELFGHWQVQDYMAPPAVDGKVPRNEYGNVELYQPCMLPPGTVHLQLPGLPRVARKLHIDCAPALVGWVDFMPVLEGFVVCEEFKDLLIDAWNKDVDESAKRQQEKRDLRIYGNWKKLIKGLLIRERLQKKYNFSDPSTSTSTETDDKKSKRRPFRKKTK